MRATGPRSRHFRGFHPPKPLPASHFPNSHPNQRLLGSHFPSSHRATRVLMRQERLFRAPGRLLGRHFRDCFQKNRKNVRSNKPIRPKQPLPTHVFAPEGRSAQPRPREAASAALQRRSVSQRSNVGILCDLLVNGYQDRPERASTCHDQLISRILVEARRQACRIQNDGHRKRNDLCDVGPPVFGGHRFCRIHVRHRWSAKKGSSDAREVRDGLGARMTVDPQFP